MGAEGTTGVAEVGAMRSRPNLRWLGVLLGFVLASTMTACTVRTPTKASPTTTAPRQATASSELTASPWLIQSPTTSGNPTPTASLATPTSRPTPEPARWPTPEEAETVTFTIVFDNNAYTAAGLEGLRTSWGFACWVETGETTVLFDTGGDGATLLHNLDVLGLDPLMVDTVVLSHAHGDHTSGLDALLDTGAMPTVYAPASYSPAFKDKVRARTEVVEVSGAVTVAPGIHSTGEVGTMTIEQSLVVETGEGLVVVTGCAHPGVVKIVRRAHERFDDGIALVVGGFHLGGSSRGGVESIIRDFHDLSVQRVAPCHCTGDEARRLFDEAFGDDCVLAGVGWSTEFVHDASDWHPVAVRDGIREPD
jgi:7,8-dihydropterin-6-yl-methyl-4-(beta-D-ribofuranosyl)aminobenzene 5'-phosphate synthase